MGKGKGVTVIRGRGGILAVDGFGPVIPVIQDGNRERDAVQGIETARGIADGLALAGKRGLSLPPFQFGLAEVAEGNDERILPDRHEDAFFVERLHELLHGRAALGDAGLGPGEPGLVGKISLAILVERLVVFGLPALTFQLGEAQLQQILPGPEGDGAHCRVRHQGFERLLAQGLLFSVLRREAVGDMVAQRRFGRIASGDLFLQQLVDLILLRLLIGHLSMAEQVPEDIFTVVPDEFLERAAEVGSQIAVELRMLSPSESVQRALYVLPALFGGLAGEFTHPGIGHDGLVEAIHQALELRLEGVLELPVATPFRLDVLLARIVEVGGKVPRHRFIADVLQDFSFLLGPVGLVHLFVFRPAGGEDVSVRIHVGLFI